MILYRCNAFYPNNATSMAFTNVRGVIANAILPSNDSNRKCVYWPILSQ
jgi:hypothetical protein